MPGSLTTQCRQGTRSNAPVRIAFRRGKGVGTLKYSNFAAQWLAYSHPCQRLRRTSRYATHDSGSAWFARPLLLGTCTLSSLSVSRRTTPHGYPINLALPFFHCWQVF